MRDFVITVNSTVDLPREWLEERNVPVIPLKYTIDGETYTDMYGLSAKEFFDKLREGHMSVTSQINPGEAEEMLEPFLKEGKDILHLGFSSGLSGTLNSMKIAGAETLWKNTRRQRSSLSIRSAPAWGRAFFCTRRFSSKKKERRSMRSSSGSRRISCTSAMM